MFSKLDRATTIFGGRLRRLLGGVNEAVAHGFDAVFPYMKIKNAGRTSGCFVRGLFLVICVSRDWYV